MRLGSHKAGSVTLFVDTSCDEVLLRIEVDEETCSLIAFRLYDARGNLVEDSPELKAFPSGYSVTADDSEVLLKIPPDLEGNLIYRLYNHKGQLLTCSDGKRTQIFGHLRMDGKSVGPWRPKPGAEPAIVSETTAAQADGLHDAAPIGESQP